MAAWIDEDGFVRRAPWWTMDGLRYPLTVPGQAPAVKWTDAPLLPTAEMLWKAIVIYTGPEAPLPVSVARQWVFEIACGLTVDQWQRIASAEAAQGIPLNTPESVAQILWDKVYGFRPYVLA